MDAETGERSRRDGLLTNGFSGLQSKSEGLYPYHSCANSSKAVCQQRCVEFTWPCSRKSTLSCSRLTKHKGVSCSWCTCGRQSQRQVGGRFWQTHTCVEIHKAVISSCHPGAAKQEPSPESPPRERRWGCRKASTVPVPQLTTTTKPQITVAK